ncbi:hypothetical protein [Sulfurimonas sp.]|uniref:hypothetical protein n=1 Tax=Sulfurimonas sp. TaxID=2022749 RepID=UPI0026111362|nr:hypothetical protein [Sulfurimonas sp.]MCW8895538.1 hypothetical protein [Sulfurimonas sp.]MCW9067984.1 hypothetical protein [Sulfurimonas sp.]
METTTLLIILTIAITSFFAGWISKNNHLEFNTKQVLEEIKNLMKHHKTQLSNAYQIYNMTEHKEQLKDSNIKVMAQIQQRQQELQEIDEEYRDKKYFLAEQERIAKQEQNNKNETIIKDLKSKSGNLKIDK